LKKKEEENYTAIVENLTSQPQHCQY